MSDVAICVEGLSKRYRLGERQRSRSLRESLTAAVSAPFRRRDRQAQETIWALKDVSFEVRRGEVVGVIGRNGAGKSTLLKILSRITEPTSGRAEVHGRVGSLLEVGTGFHNELTGRENIYLNGAILGMKRAEIASKFDEIVAFAEVERFLDTPVKHYSSGMYLRLAFAVAAHLEPEILLVDEVLAVGDAAFQRKCLGKMGEVARGGITVILVSHNTAAVMNLCERAVLLENGRVRMCGSAPEVIREYAESFGRNSDTDLSSVAQRSGLGEVRFTQIALLNDKTERLSRGVAGDPLLIELRYESTDQRTLNNARSSLAVLNTSGQILFVCSSEVVSAGAVNIPPAGTMTCRIPRLPLSQGLYSMMLFLEVNHEIQDWIRGGVPLEVLDGDFYGTSRLYPEGWQGKGVLIPYQWSFCETDNGST